jgi:hypothetical protein
LNKIRDKGRTGSAWKCGREGGKKVVEGGRGRNDPKTVFKCE